jgi:hypothetical protein
MEGGAVEGDRVQGYIQREGEGEREEWVRVSYKTGESGYAIYNGINKPGPYIKPDKGNSQIDSSTLRLELILTFFRSFLE